MNIINCAVVGVGYLGNFHAQKYLKLPNTKLVAVCDSDEQRCNEIASQYNVAAHTDYKKLIGAVDAVSIVTTTTSHYQIAKFFLENNVHVLLEKPITTTVAEADELIQIANKNNLTLQIGHLERFNPAFLAVKERLEQPIFVECARLAPYKVRCTDVSVILDLMIHDLDLVHTLIDSPIKHIDAFGAAVLSPTPDIAQARIVFENGAIANLNASRINPKMERRLNLYQKNTYFTADLQEKIVNMVSPNNQHEFVLDKGDALLDEIIAFADAIINKTPPVVSATAGKLALETAIAIEKLVANATK